MNWRIEIQYKDNIFDAQAAAVEKNIIDLGLKKHKQVRIVNVYNLEGDLLKDHIDIICRQLLVNPITQHVVNISSQAGSSASFQNNNQVVEIAYNQGVMDPVEESSIKGIQDLGFPQIQSVRTAKRYIFNGSLSQLEISLITEKILFNKLIQHINH